MLQKWLILIQASGKKLFAENILLHLQLEIKNGILLKFDFVCVTFFVVSHSILLVFDFFQMTREFQS